MTRHAASPTTSARTTTVVAVRALAVATTAVLAFQFVTAGGLLTGGNPALHGAGAIVLHVVTGLLALAAAGHRATAGGPTWPPVLAAAVFAATFVQAGYGSVTGLVVHVPGALVLTAGTVWLAAWSFLRLP